MTVTGTGEHVQGVADQAHRPHTAAGLAQQRGRDRPGRRDRPDHQRGTGPTPPRTVSVHRRATRAARRTVHGERGDQHGQRQRSQRGERRHGRPADGDPAADGGEFVQRAARDGGVVQARAPVQQHHTEGQHNDDQRVGDGPGHDQGAQHGGAGVDEGQGHPGGAPRRAASPSGGQSASGCGAARGENGDSAPCRPRLLPRGRGNGTFRSHLVMHFLLWLSTTTGATTTPSNSR